MGRPYITRLSGCQLRNAIPAFEKRAAVVVDVVVEHTARVHLEAVIKSFLLRIRIDEDFHRVVLIRRIVVLLEAGVDVGVGGVEADVERLRVPDDARAGLLFGACLASICSPNGVTKYSNPFILS